MSAVMKDRNQEIDVFSLPVYPDADLLPMLADDEMADMVESIKANGQREPITIAQVDTDEGEQWMLIDGRNRREACRLTGVEPKYEIFEGDDDAIKEFIADANKRRHNTKGQLAMATAIMFPETQQGKRTDLSTSFLKNDVSSSQIRYARAVLTYAPDLKDNVLSGAASLNDAYKQAQDRKAAASSYETKFSALQAKAPDLAELVKEERLSLEGAIAEADRRAKEEEIKAKNRREALFAALSDAVIGAREFDDEKSATEVRGLLTDDRYRMEWNRLFPQGWQTELSDLRKAQRGIKNLLAAFRSTLSREESSND